VKTSAGQEASKDLQERMNKASTQTGFRDLGRLLRPKSVAVIGASEQPGNLAGVAVSLMKKFGFEGPVWPVNPNRASVHGLKCFPRIADLPAPADLAIIGTGVDPTPAIVAECASAGMTHGVIWAGGYSETGPEGAAQQSKLLEQALRHDFTFAGPNCIGIINSRTSMVASFASFLVETDRLAPGSVAMISQSGGLATMAQASAQQRGMGFGLTVSTGNEAMLEVADYIHAVASDETISVIACYIEGVRDGPRFLQAVHAARGAGKQVVVLKGGLSAAGAQAAAAHTGALAGAGRVWQAVARDAGIITAGSIEELLDVSLYLSLLDRRKMPRGNRVAVVSFGGGSGVLAVDQCEAHGLAVPPLRPETRARLAGLVTPLASVENPVDVTPQTFNQEKWFASFPDALETIAADSDIDIMLLQFGPQAQRGVETAAIASRLRLRTDKTVCLAWPFPPPGALDLLHAEEMFVFHEFERAIRAIAKLAEHGVNPATEPPTGSLLADWSEMLPAPAHAQVIGEHECHGMLAKFGVSVAPGGLARNDQEAVAIANGIGYPVVAKGISAKVMHRASAGLVALDLRNDDDVRSAFARLTRTGAAVAGALDGVYLQKLVRGGVEIIVSAFRDPIFGIMISCGWGGNLTEVIDDAAIAPAPVGETAAEDLLKRLKVVKGAASLERDARLPELARFVAHFSQVAAAAPWQEFVIELNPVKWGALGVVAVDGLLIVQKP